MKKLKSLLMGAIFVGAGLLLPRAARAGDALLDGTIFTDPILAYSTAPAFNVSRLESISMQATYSSATVAAMTVTDGVKSTNTIVVVSTSGLSGARITMNGYTLDNGAEWTSVSTASGTAKAIADAINATPGLKDIVSSTWAANGTVYSTSAVVGTAPNSWTMFSSTPSALLVNNFSNGAATAISITTDKITTSSAHGISTGAPLLFVKVTGTVPTGLTTATTYYAIVSDAVSFKLASSSANALAGTAIDITAITGSGSFTLTPTAFAGTWSFKWQGSNDNLNWADLNATAITYSVPATTLWDGLVHYKYLRLNFTAGTGGGMNIKVVGYGQGRSTP